MRSNKAATAALRAGINNAQSSAQSKTFLALLRRETAGHCHGAGRNHHGLGPVARAQHAPEECRLHDLRALSSIRRYQRGAFDDVEGACISAMLSASAGEAPGPHPDAQLT